MKDCILFNTARDRTKKSFISLFCSLELFCQSRSLGSDPRETLFCNGILDLRVRRRDRHDTTESIVIRQSTLDRNRRSRSTIQTRRNDQEETGWILLGAHECLGHSGEDWPRNARVVALHGEELERTRESSLRKQRIVVPCWASRGCSLFRKPNLAWRCCTTPYKPWSL